MSIYSKFKTKIVGLATTGLVLVSGASVAAVPVEVTTAMTDAKTDALAIAALALIIIISLAAFKYMRRAAN